MIGKHQSELSIFTVYFVYDCASQPSTKMESELISKPAYNHTIYILMALQKRIKTVLITECVMEKRTMPFHKRNISEFRME